MQNHGFVVAVLSRKPKTIVTPESGMKFTDVYTFLNGFASPPFLFQGPRKAKIIANSLNTVVGYDLLGLPTGPVLHDASRQQLSQLVAVRQAKAGQMPCRRRGR